MDPAPPLRAAVYARTRFEDALDLPKQGYALAAQGHSQWETGRRLGIHPRTVARLLGKP
jgi:hypothetical protein